MAQMTKVGYDLVTKIGHGTIEVDLDRAPRDWGQLSLTITKHLQGTGELDYDQVALVRLPQG